MPNVLAMLLWRLQQSPAPADGGGLLDDVRRIMADLTAFFARTTLRLLAAAAIVLLTLVAMWALGKLLRYLQRLVADRYGKYFKDVVVKGYTILRADHSILFVDKLLVLLFWVLRLLVVYFALSSIFSLFAQTQAWAGTLLSWVLNPAQDILLGLWRFLPNLFAIIVIVVVTHYSLRLVGFLASEIQGGRLRIAGFYPDWAGPTLTLVKVLIYAFMLVTIFPYLPGSHSEVFQGMSVFIGILISLGSSSLISNLMAGIVITYMRPFRRGDRIRIADVTGDVVEKTLLVTRVRTPKNEDVTIPNANILSSYTTNYSTATAPEELGVILYTSVTIGYDVPWTKMHQALIDAGLRCSMVEKTPTPFVLQTSLDDFYVSYQLNVYTRQPSQQLRIRSELHQHIQDVCFERDIEIMSPHRYNLRDGSAIAMPESYLAGKAKNTEPFRVEQLPPAAAGDADGATPAPPSPPTP